MTADRRCWRVVLLACLLLAALPGRASADTRVVGAGGRFLYLVDGMPQPIHGMGYNAILTGLTPDERVSRLRHDFGLMRRVGVNTILGWDQDGFDRTLLDVAHAHGLGVIAHFELKKGWDYADPALRARLLDEVGAWVDAYADHPAVRMWGVGNEVMLAFDDEQAAQFARFYVEIYQRVREHDQRHPVLYREAEDVRAPFFRDAFREAGVAPVDFVFGMNFYTPRIEDALSDWPALGFDVPVLISELAPAGLAPMTRPSGFADLWRRVLTHEQFVLGATPYVWTTEGPEAVDRIFGLTDERGRPVDGSLAALQRLYRGGAPLGELLPAPAPRTPQPLGVSLDAGIAQALARAVAMPDLEPIDLAAAQAALRQRYAAELAGAPGAALADRRRMARMLDLLVQVGLLAQLRREGAPIYPGAVEALPLLSGMARWAAVDPGAEAVAEDFLTEVIAQALRPPAAEGDGAAAARG
ncbi:MAG TPA: glycoside hydrolase family 2 TIM barrel-domain containing protein [Chloroflexota bacterium]|jgi:hypothetical protein